MTAPIRRSGGSDEPLLEALAAIQARGAIGERSLPDAVLHASQFIALIPTFAADLVDLGSGGGLPALVIAWRRPDLRVTMVERRATRADMLRRAISSLGLGDSCTVTADDAKQFARRSPASFDVVTARSFGSPAVVAPIAARLLRRDGLFLVSEPPDDVATIDRWPVDLLRTVGLSKESRSGSLQSFRRHGS